MGKLYSLLVTKQKKKKERKRHNKYKKKKKNNYLNIKNDKIYLGKLRQRR